MSAHNLLTYRPNLHFAPKENWMNDPNGMVYFKGEYHLFFQHNPNDSIHGPMHWGHAVSKDMISWEQLDIALYPDDLGTIFSGSAVVDWHNTSGFFPNEPGLVAIFTHHLHEEGKTPVQRQSLAFSSDQGRSWIKYKQNPVLVHETKVDFRDPKVMWHNDTNKWVMAVATGQTISFYSSLNLREWKYESEFGERMGSHDGVWECPDLFELPIIGKNESKWVLLVSIGDNPKLESGSRTQYFVGSFDGHRFTPHHKDIKWLDAGKDNYAGVSFSDIPEMDGRRIYLGWMSNWRYANKVPTYGWRSQMTLPRELQLQQKQDSYAVIQTPVKELESYFSKSDSLSNVVVSDDSPFQLELNAPYFMFDFVIENVDAASYNITLHHTSDQITTLHIDTKKNLLLLDRSQSGKVDFSSNFTHVQTIELDCTAKLKLCAVADSSSIEVFVNDGEYALTSLIYPDKICSKLSVSSEQGTINIVKGIISVPSE
ncbi:glycoside hydrolase family 32 protein [Terribacillus sp. 179-K 1B1 HS]|uniref:glycoside hydrolase family 32 protein n=1 Tax=Terribacillus sp. 179-K 1B1 HS TaxID=3142388 RepID=UPI0039A3A960